MADHSESGMPHSSNACANGSFLGSTNYLRRSSYERTHCRCSVLHRTSSPSSEWMIKIITDASALYRAAWILLYRLFLPNSILVRLPSQTSLYQEASTTCTHMAEELHQLFQLYSKTFKLRNMNFILTWSMVGLLIALLHAWLIWQYSAATINAIDFQSEDTAMSTAASPRLGLSLHVLERGSLQSPGTKRVSRCLIAARIVSDGSPSKSSNTACELRSSARRSEIDSIASVPIPISLKFRICPLPRLLCSVTHQNLPQSRCHHLQQWIDPSTSQRCHRHPISLSTFPLCSRTTDSQCICRISRRTRGWISCRV